jgi:hypothetical protein
MLFQGAARAGGSASFPVTQPSAKPSLPFAILIDSGLCLQSVTINSEVHSPTFSLAPAHNLKVEL